MSLKYLKEAVADNDTEKLIRYVRLHLGDGNEVAGRKEIDKAGLKRSSHCSTCRPQTANLFSKH